MSRCHHEIDENITIPTRMASTQPSLSGRALAGLSVLLGWTFAVRIFSFVFNVAVARALGPALYGVSAVRLELLLQTTLFAAREAFRNACLGSAVAPPDAQPEAKRVFLRVFFFLVFFFVGCGVGLGVSGCGGGDGGGGLNVCFLVILAASDPTHQCDTGPGDGKGDGDGSDDDRGRAGLSEADRAGRLRDLMNAAWASVPVTICVGLVAAAVFLYLAPDGSDTDGPPRGVYITAVCVYTLAGILEGLSEPLAILAQNVSHGQTCGSGYD